MDFRVDTCLGCKKMMKFARLNFCDECKEKYLDLIKEYLREHESSNGYAIAKALKISPKIVEYYIQEGVLINVDSLDKQKYNNLKAFQDMNNQMQQKMNEKRLKEESASSVKTLYLSNIKKR